jgi:hypothetical protein
VQEQFVEEMAAQQVKHVQIMQQYPFPYFHHFGKEDIGNIWDLWELQGKSKTLWLGASASFESVHDVVSYNLQLLDRFSKTSSDISEAEGLLKGQVNCDRLGPASERQCVALPYCQWDDSDYPPKCRHV